jgi:uncharacterized membrane protein YedE/YeeE
MRIVAALLAGVLFGAGLVISGMTDPNNVLSFLDVAGNWNSSLAFVMAGAIAVAAPAFAYARRKKTAVLGEAIVLPAGSPVDLPLILGAALFGAGWGLSGICPGPAVVLLSTLQVKAVVFFAAVLAGIGLAAALRSKARENSTVLQKDEEAAIGQA